ncbi:carboxypeptidase-like regulatory domain-containing protein [Mucilaginibacter calamicampi]|uniref:Carboxypeptidase-like regulatory domain-containing protein n=1 Tax=Mucilaginibacter calamicampi TaxID=1302352 RepID=A0ABW2YY59_9SPHI
MTVKSVCTKMTFCYQLFVAVLLMFPVLLNAQAIRGTVTDEITGKPLAGVSIYFDGTFKGTSTDSAGNFAISNTLKTSSPLVVSYMGYQSQKIANYTDANLTIALKSKAIVLSEVVIGGDEISRDKAMKIFLKEFIGEDSKDCVIENPEEIYFRYFKKKDLLTADADKPLIISNKILGYKITYFLTSFSHSPLQTKYKGNYFFTEDIDGLKPAKVKEILKERDEAYFGSRMHFIRSLWANELSQNNFLVYRTPKGITDASSFKLDAANVLSSDDIIQNADSEKFMMLAKEADANSDKFNNNEIFITYKHGNDSFIQQEDSYAGVIIDKNGFYDEGLEWKGNIGVYRVSRLLPFEFVPSK